MYVVAVTVLVSLLLTAFVAVILKKDDASPGGWLSRLVQAAQLLATLLYSILWVGVLDYLVVM